MQGLEQASLASINTDYTARVKAITAGAVTKLASSAKVAGHVAGAADYADSDDESQ